MKLFDELIKATQVLSMHNGAWAICGGVAASIYRSKPRFTDDIDFALIDTPAMSARQLAELVTTTLGFKSYLGFVPSPSNPNSQVIGLICARETDSERFVGLDFLLPVQCWVEDAVQIAQSNLIDYGFAKLPTITPEYLIIAKLIALTSNPDRIQDLDDIKEIRSSIAIDNDFIRTQLAKNGAAISEELLKTLL